MKELLPFLVERAGQYAHCTLDTCPIKDSVYGYLPSKIVNIILTGLFGISFIAHLVQGIRSKSWTFLIALGVGTAMEAVGYVGRLRLRKDPFSRSSLGIQLVALTVAPAFLAGGIYLTLKHIIIVYGAKFSRIAPRSYTWIFVSCDILSILIQAGGAAAASQGTNPATGNDIMMVGLVSQVVTLVIFGVMAVDVFFRIRKFRGEFNESTTVLRNSRRFKGLLIAIAVAYTAILARCLYRIAEMAGGWRNPIMQNQIVFIIMDSVMCVIAVFALNFFHPGFLFKESYATLKNDALASNNTQMEAI